MSVYKHKDSPFYHFDFQYKGDRFHGSTGCTSRREAEAFERAERDRAKQQVKLSLSRSRPSWMTSPAATGMRSVSITLAQIRHGGISSA